MIDSPQPAYLIDLCAKTCRERSLLRVEELLDWRTRELRASEAQNRQLQKAESLGLTVQSAPGQGSVFRVFIPVLETTQIAPQPSEIVHPPPGPQAVPRLQRVHQPASLKSPHRRPLP